MTVPEEADTVALERGRPMTDEMIERHHWDPVSPDEFEHARFPLRHHGEFSDHLPVFGIFGWVSSPCMMSQVTSSSRQEWQPDDPAANMADDFVIETRVRDGVVQCLMHDQIKMKQREHGECEPGESCEPTGEP